MKLLFTISLLWIILFGFNTAVVAQDSPLQPTIVEIEFPNQMSTHKRKPVSDDYNYYMKAYDETPVDLQREPERPAKLFVKGRSHLNHVEIYDEDAPDDAYPLIDVTFRGTNYQEIDLSKLGDGNYEVRVVSLHTETYASLSLSTAGAD